MKTVAPESKMAQRELDDWHVEKNNGVDPLTVSRGANKVYWWQSQSCKHEFDMSPKEKANAAGCPICNGKRVLVGFNDLPTVFPVVAGRWHPTLNYGRKPEEFTAFSHFEATWVCPKFKHPYISEIASQTSQGAGCNICAGKFVLAGFNDLATKYVEVAKQWHPTKNTCRADEVFPNESKVERWWYSQDCGHEWPSPIVRRTSSGTGCLVCANYYIVSGINDMATTDPDITAQLHPTKNKNFDPTKVSIGYNEPLIWLCKDNHDWPALAYTRRTNGCPYCAWHYAWPGETDLATTHPLLAGQWHPTKNGELEPTQVTARTGRSKNHLYWWLDEFGHEWSTASVYERAVDGNGCLKCWQGSHTSEPERVIAQMVEATGLEIVRNDRTLLGGNREIDIYVPGKKIGIEYNGVNWHTEAKGKGRMYHHEKYAAAKAKGVQLVQIWEDDYKRNPEIVLNLLRHKLGISEQKRIAARMTNAALIGMREAEAFLDANHLQGFIQGSSYHGLRDSEGKLVAVMAIRQVSEQELYLTRYATNKVVVGGFSNLLAAAQKAFPKAKQIHTFSDNMVSEGVLYAAHGFYVASVLDPEVFYVRWAKRYRPQSFRKSFFEKHNLRYKEGSTRDELAALNGFEKTWDAGKVKWVKFLG